MQLLSSSAQANHNSFFVFWCCVWVVESTQYFTSTHTGQSTRFFKTMLGPIWPTSIALLPGSHTRKYTTRANCTQELHDDPSLSARLMLTRGQDPPDTPSQNRHRLTCSIASRCFTWYAPAWPSATRSRAQLQTATVIRTISSILSHHKQESSATCHSIALG